MKKHPQEPATPAALRPVHWDVPIRVRLAPYVAFGQWMDQELQTLVERWRGTAAPCAMRWRR